MNPIFESAFTEYHSVSQIGGGGCGTVWHVTDPDGKVFAIKHLNPESVTSDKTKRFKNELAFCARSSHKNILRVFDWGYINIKKVKCPFYVMPLFSGTLRKMITAGISREKILPYLSQILDGVEAAHMLGVWHRDLKPENILFDSRADSLVIADFGIAHFAEDQLQTVVVTGPHARMANFQYAAPEQRLKPYTADARADVYALGLILNEMFTGLLAHGVGFKCIADVAPDFKYLDDIINAMLLQDPAKRPQSIRAIKEQLIARGNDFVSQQKLTALKATVIPEGTPDDILITSPPELVSARWDNGYLYFTLSHSVNNLWAACFNTLGNYTSIMGKGPDAFHIQGNTLRVGVDYEREAEELVGYTKSYIKMANAEYKRRVELELLKSKQKAEQELKRRIAIEEKSRAINARLKI